MGIQQFSSRDWSIEDTAEQARDCKNSFENELVVSKSANLAFAFQSRMNDLKHIHSLTQVADVDSMYMCLIKGDSPWQSQLVVQVF